MSLREVIRRWSLCRCVYARPPVPDRPCRCTPAELERAAREGPEQTRRWERTLAEREGRR